MGGNAAKERRKLKRLAEQEKLNNNTNNVNTTGEEKTKTSSTKDTNVKYSGSIASSQSRGDRKDVNLKRKFADGITNYHSSNKQHRSHDVGKDKKDTGHKKNNSKIPIKAKKVKKPKHLARKLQNETDPEILRKLSKQQTELDAKKLKRREKFRLKVIELVGGEKFFDSKVFDELMENGGGKIETIVEAVKIDMNSRKSEGKNQHVHDAKNSRDKKLIDKKKSTLGHESNDVSVNVINDIETEEESSDSEKESQREKVENTIIPENGSIESKNNEKVDIGHTSSSTSSSSNSSSESDSDDDRELTLSSGRTRGRRRRGRQDADAKREEQNEILQRERETKSEDLEIRNTTENDEKVQRRCIGRKPLTDFEVGKKYTGTIVYIKPKLGLFIDIGCHSDAFIHISRCADEFVETITDDFFKVGDLLESKVRLVNIDRKSKKLTASLQSDDRIKDEEKSNETWNSRKLERNRKRETKRLKTGSKEKHQNNLESGADSEIHYDDNEPKQTTLEAVPIVIDPDNMTPAELKRARKLQRRAERRLQQETTGISA